MCVTNIFDIHIIIKIIGTIIFKVPTFYKKINKILLGDVGLF